MTDAAFHPPADAPAPAGDAGVVDAGEFGAWLEQALRVLAGQGESEVPCGTCTGCCTSSYYIRIRPRDRAAVARFEAHLVTPPDITPGDALLGWRADGTCPALEAGKCTIYAQRPMTCRDYDCRVFAAAGVLAGDERRAVINQRIKAWRFSHAGEEARRAHQAVLAASTFIQKHGDWFPACTAPTSPTGIAVMALKTYKVFLAADTATEPRDVIARRMLEAARAFDAAAQEEKAS